MRPFALLRVTDVLPSFISLPSPKRSACAGLHEIDVEVGRDGVRDPGPQIALVAGQPHTDRGVVEMLDLEIEMRHLGEVFFEELVQVGGRHERHDGPSATP